MIIYMTIYGPIWPHMATYGDKSNIDPTLSPALSPTLNPTMKYDLVFGSTVRFLINFYGFRFHGFRFLINFRLTDPRFSVIGSVSRFAGRECHLHTCDAVDSTSQ